MGRVIIYVTCALIPLAVLLGYGVALCLFRGKQDDDHEKHYN